MIVKPIIRLLYRLCNSELLIIPDLCYVPEVVAGKVDIIWSKNPGNPLAGDGFYYEESDEVLLIKVTCFSDYQLIGDVFHLCENGVWKRESPICESKFVTEVKYVEALFFHNVMKYPVPKNFHH